MRILFYRWGAYTEKDIVQELTAEGVTVCELIYPVSDKHHDEKLEKMLGDMIAKASFDAVFSINYFPVVASVCNVRNIKYISWTYDAPLNVTNIEKTLGYETNYVFMFDRIQAAGYINAGFNNVYHLPLAVSTKRYDKVMLTDEDRKKYRAEISFVGNLYSDILNAYTEPLTDYQKGYIEALCSAQSQLYGSYILDEIIDDKLIDGINERYRQVKPDTDVTMSKEALSFGMASSITRRERLTILALASKFHKLDYYSREKTDILQNARYQGTVDYYSEMPKVFKMSDINLNITLKILQSGIPLRALDIMGCGGFLLSNYQQELAERFENGNEVVMYESIEDAFEKISYYLKHPDEIERIRANGYKKVVEEFNYDISFRKIFSIAGL